MPTFADQRVFLIRHGETEWSVSGQHTGVTDLPLTENGRAVARLLTPVLAQLTFARVFTSPLRRACETCELAGLARVAALDGDLMEWDYGDYEGLTTADIHTKAPGWSLFRDGCPGGETPDDVGRRVDRVIGRVRAVGNDVALFAHGHVFSVFASRWLGLPASSGRHFLLNTATLCVLSHYGGAPAITRWNAPVALEALHLASRSHPQSIAVAATLASGGKRNTREVKARAESESTMSIDLATTAQQGSTDLASESQSSVDEGGGSR